jgi:AcrR family transcriptional regulator
MTSPGLRQRRKALTREEIIDAAIDLFERKGYEATTVDDIAEAADVSPRTFFRYFDSKFEVALAGKAPDGNDPAPYFTARPANETVLQAIRSTIREKLVKEAGTSDKLRTRQLRVVLKTPSLLAMAREHFHRGDDEMVRAVAARLGVDEDELRPRVIVAAAGGTIWAVIERWIESGGESDTLGPMLDEAFEILERGLD